MEFALINDAVVAQVIVADAEFVAGIAHEWDHIEPVANGAGIGWRWTAQGGFTAPPAPSAPEPVALPRHLSKLGFRNRFTQAEKVAIEIASLDNPAASMAQRQQAAALRATQADQRDALYIDLERPDTRAGVLELEAAGLLAAGRALAILDTPVADGERYKG